MNRLQASALVLLLWAAIYLPGLGSTEIKGEEGRRILPAITMLETGNWLVPYVGGKPFLRKPPLVNWAIAASFELTGVRNEWTARLPSALCVLALALTIAGTSGPGWLNAETAFAAAVMAMTQFGLLAKARFAGAEIEGIYVPLSGIAIVCWLAWWSRGCSPWLMWPVSGAFLGLASLAKGPSFHLLFFYAIVIAVLWSAARRERSPLVTFPRHFFHPAHFAGLALAAAIFAAWAVPYFRTPESRDAIAVWKRQGIDRFTESEFNAEIYFLNIPRALMDQLPWLLLAPAAIGALLRRRDRGGEGDEREPAHGKENSPQTSADEPGEAEENRGLRGLTRISEEPIRVDPRNPRSSFPGIFSSSAEARCALALKAAAIVSAACLIVVLLVPGTLPRYVLPLGVPFALVLAWACAGSERVLGRWLLANRVAASLVLLAALAAPIAAGWPLAAGERFDLAAAVKAAFAASLACACCAFVLARRGRALSLGWVGGASGALFAAAMLVYAAAAPRWLARRDDVRPIASAINAAMPPGERLVLYDPGYLAAIFYLRNPYRYATSLDEIPAGARWVLARGKQGAWLAEKRPDFEISQKIAGKNRDDFFLLQRSGEIKKLPVR